MSFPFNSLTPHNSTLLKTLTLFVSSGLFLSACGGGGGSSTVSSGEVTQDGITQPAANIPLIDAAFKDSPASGLRFESASISGFTGSNGKFQCNQEAKETVVFKVGNVTLGQATCQALVTPLDLSSDGLSNPGISQNLVRFLMLLDEDQNTDNGIKITDALSEMASGWAQIDFNSDNFETELTQIISDVSSLASTAVNLPSGTEADQHLRETLLCEYGGVYAGDYEGVMSGKIYFIINPVDGSIQAYVKLPTALVESGYIKVDSHVPENVASETTFSVKEGYYALDVEFSDAETLTGQWSELQFNLGGPLTAKRLKKNLDSNIRFAGEYITEDGISLLEMDGVVTGEDDETNPVGQLSGQLLSITTGNITQVSGSFTLPGSNSDQTSDAQLSIADQQQNLGITIQQADNSTINYSFSAGDSFSGKACSPNPEF